jgi:protein TonB
VNVRYTNLATVIAAHGAVIAALLAAPPVRQAVFATAPILVSFVQAEAPTPSAPPKPAEPEKPKPVAKPEPKRKPKPESAPMLTATPVPSASTPTEAQPAPRAAEPSPPAEAAPSAPAGPVAFAPPRFNADYLHNPVPAYPSISRRLGEEGRVVLRVFVDADGAPAQVEMRTSSGFPRLDEVALDTVRKWKFVPARQGERAVAAWVLVPISFSLKG